MKRFTLFLCSMLMALTGAWAETYTITFDHRTGTFYKGNAVSTGWVNKWVSNEEGKPVVTITASANNINTDNGRMAPGSATTCTYSISVEDGYFVTGFSMNCPTFGADVTVTPSGESPTVVSTGGTLVVNSSASSFVYSGSNSGRIQASAGDGGSFVITVVKPTDEQLAAYQKVQGWVSTIQGAEGLVTDASNYVSNAKESSEGSYAALLDGEYTTYFHSCWNNGPAEDHYLQATLPEAVDAFYFYFKKRSQNEANRPTSITISGSNDGTNFTDVTTINSGLPTTSGVLDYASSKINLNASYQYIRFTVTATNTGAQNNGHVFFTFSEFYMLPSNSHVDDAMAFYLSGKKAYEYTDEEIAQVNAIDLEVRSATLAPAKANVIATYAIPDGKVGTVGYPTQAAWDTFVATINAITIEDDFDAIKNAAIDALMASAKLADGVYKIRNFSTDHYLYQDEANAIVTYATTEAVAGNNGYWRVTNNGDGTFDILDLYGHQLAKGNQSSNWASVQNGSYSTVTTITRDYTDANYKTDGDLVSVYLSGAHINTGYNTGSKVFVTTWTTGGLGSNANHWFFEPVDVSESTAYTITITGAPEAITMGDGTILTNGTSTVFLAGTEQILAPEITNYEVSKVVEGTIVTITYTITDYEALVTAYLTADKLQNIQQAGKIGYPSTSSEVFTNLYGLISTFTGGHTYTASDYENIQTYYPAYISSDDIVLPKTGKFYRFKSNATGQYIGFAENGSQPMVDESDAAIYYYTEAQGILSYNKGRYLSANTGNAVTDIGTDGPAFGFYKTGYSNPTFGTLRIRDLNSVKGSLIAWTDGYLNGWGAGDHERCEWIVEEVTALPVSISAAGYATLYAPVALTIPAGVKAYTGVINKKWLDLEEVGSKIPANTAVILKLEDEPGSYDFEITTADAFEGNNDLQGTVGGKAVEANSILTLQKIDDVVGLYTYTGSTLAGFKAYMDMPGAEVKGLTFKFDNATGINGVDAAAQNGTIYNLAGQRVQKAQKGIYIVNGKKVLF